MKYLMSFHNQQGLENILPIAQKLCENELNEVSLLDLRELYGQPKISFQNLNNIFVKSENSIFKNDSPPNVNNTSCVKATTAPKPNCHSNLNQI